MTLTQEHFDILKHTKRAPRQAFCGDSKQMQELVAAGYMRSLGKVAWCPDEYFTITPEGREALNQEGTKDKAEAGTPLSDPTPFFRQRFECKHRERYRLSDGTCSDCGEMVGKLDTLSDRDKSAPLAIPDSDGVVHDEQLVYTAGRVCSGCGRSDDACACRDELDTPPSAQEQTEATLTYEQRQPYACKVCGNVPDEHGVIEHGRGCFTQSADGGGTSYVELPASTPATDGAGKGVQGG